MRKMPESRIKLLQIKIFNGILHTHMKTEHKTINTSLTPKIKANLSLEDFHMPFNSTGLFNYKK
jgi:hypothetical protein